MIGRDVFEFACESVQWTSTPWLVIGKGPTAEQSLTAAHEPVRRVTLNDAIRDFNADIAHLIDLDALERCSAALADHAGYLLMPRHPNRTNRRLGTGVARSPSAAGLDDLQRDYPVLAEFHERGRLLTYALESDPLVRTIAPDRRVRVHGFSAASVIDLASKLGVGTVYTAGVDGGRGYATRFADLMNVTHLDAGQASYDKQFEGFAASHLDSGIEIHPFGIQTPVRVFVGGTADQRLAFEVLRYSIKRHASLACRVELLDDAVRAAKLDLPTPSDQRHRGYTSFSLLRFAIPALCRKAGRAIYLDSDMLVFDDIRRLWTFPVGDHTVLSVREPHDSGRAPQNSVLLMDCSRAQWSIDSVVEALDSGDMTYPEVMGTFADVAGQARTLPRDWNELERMRIGRTALLHYTDVPTQPWLATSNPRAVYWCEALFAAIDAGAISTATVRQEIARGHVRPSLLYQLEHRVADPLLLPRRLKARDQATFVPPPLLPSAATRALGIGKSPGRLTSALRVAGAAGFSVAQRAGLIEKIRVARKRLASARRQ
ncbi:MAG: hypothetical protein KAG72_05455 [Abyssibacter sp.]|nr:glycosyltransferase [Abyssibacter sp.]MCK5858776.1 hypothetical protein [Abyssibacter sp.]